MSVDLQLVRSTMAWVTLTGEVRHATTDDVRRVGIRFVDVSDLQHALLRRLLERQRQAKGCGQVVGSLDLQRVRRG
jgi:c-di-GMP-binding flagellar brake protein YcgR